MSEIAQLFVIVARLFCISVSNIREDQALPPAAVTILAIIPVVLKQTFIYCVCACLCTMVPVWHQFSPSTLWVLGTELRTPGLAVSPLSIKLSHQPFCNLLKDILLFL